MIYKQFQSQNKPPAPKPLTIIVNAHKSFINYLLLLRCGTEFASAFYDITIKIWQASDLTCKVILNGHTDKINFEK